ncbi:MAG: hypothetical protein JW862_16675 [Anaerolineales bacterium]|nr:hypothetical protein [Anaerolineales bacterium]
MAPTKERWPGHCAQRARQAIGYAQDNPEQNSAPGSLQELRHEQRSGL